MTITVSVPRQTARLVQLADLQDQLDYNGQQLRALLAERRKLQQQDRELRRTAPMCRACPGEPGATCQVCGREWKF